MTNIELTMGLGLGIGKNFSSLSDSLQQEMLEKAKKIHIFDQGMGFGIGWFLKSLLKNFSRTCLTKQITIENLLMA